MTADRLCGRVRQSIGRPLCCQLLYYSSPNAVCQAFSVSKRKNALKAAGSGTPVCRSPAYAGSVGRVLRVQSVRRGTVLCSLLLRHGDLHDAARTETVGAEANELLRIGETCDAAGSTCGGQQVRSRRTSSAVAPPVEKPVEVLI